MSVSTTLSHKINVRNSFLKSEELFLYRNGVNIKLFCGTGKKQHFCRVKLYQNIITKEQWSSNLSTVIDVVASCWFDPALS